MNLFQFDSRALDTIKILQQAGFNSWLVGGCVRDCLIGKPFSDYDIATTALPNQVIKLFQNDFELDLIGKQFGCVRINNQGLWLEITTLREDIKPDGRHTAIEFTNDLKRDARRRDFTMNALYWQPNEISDFFNGQADLKNQIVRFIGEADIRVQEDYLRILRFFRFSSIYANTVEQTGLDACTKHQEGLRYLSGNRVWGEWSKMLFGQNTLMVLQAIELNDIDTTIFGGKLDTQIYLSYKGSDALLLTKLLLPTLHSQHLVHRLNLNTQQKEWLETAINLELCYDFRKEYLKYGIIAKELVYYWACKYKKNSDEILVENFWNIENPLFPITGKDILKLGCQPGSSVGGYLKSTKDWWIQNNFSPNYQECLLYVESIFNK